MTTPTQHTPPSRLALAVVGLVAVACIVLAVAASFISTQVSEMQRTDLEAQRISIEATKEADRLRDGADARREMKDAHSEGVNQGGLLVLTGAAVAFGLVIATFAFAAHQMSQRNTKWPSEGPWGQL